MSTESPGWDDSEHEGTTARLSEPVSDDRDHNAPSNNARTFERNTGDHDARNRALQGELEKVRGVNDVVSKVIHSLEKSRTNMETVHNSVRSASTLLDTWTRILSQTEHNQRLLLNPQWKGATQDMEDLENESVLRQQAADRRAAEEDTRREAAARAAAEEEERKRTATPSGTRGARTRARGGLMARGASSARGGSSAASLASRRSTAVPSRAGSGIGRGIAGARARGRGA